MIKHPLYLKLYTSSNEKLAEITKEFRYFRQHKEQQSLSLDKYLAAHIYNSQDITLQEMSVWVKKFIKEYSYNLKIRFDIEHVELYLHEDRVKEIIFAIPAIRYSRWDYLWLVGRLS